MIKIKRATDSDAQVLAELGRKTFLETFAKDNRPEDIELYIAETFGADKQLQEFATLIGTSKWRGLGTCPPASSI